MRKWDVYEDDLPAELRGVYDIVHVRFFLCVIRDGDPRPLLRNLLMMLSMFDFLSHSLHPVEIRGPTARSPRKYINIFDKASFYVHKTP